MKIPSKKLLDELRIQYPAGTRVELIFMDDPQAPPVGTRGTVYAVDDFANVCIKWDNNSRLSAVYGVDDIRKIEE